MKITAVGTTIFAWEAIPATDPRAALGAADREERSRAAAQINFALLERKKVGVPN